MITVNMTKSPWSNKMIGQLQSNEIIPPKCVLGDHFFHRTIFFHIMVVVKYWMSETPFFLVFVLAQNMLLAQFSSQAFGSILLFPLRHGWCSARCHAGWCVQSVSWSSAQRAPSVPSCSLNVIVLRENPSCSLTAFALLFFVWKSWARNVNLRKWLNVRLILKVCVYIVKRHRARSDTCYRLNIFHFFFWRAPGEKNIEPVTRRWASNETLSPYAGLSA